MDRLLQLTTAELRREYRELFGEEPRSGNRTFLWKRIAWRRQSVAGGDLSERARSRAEELANDADLRTRAPSGTFENPQANEVHALVVPYCRARGGGLPVPGAVLVREYRGRTVRVTVLESGSEFEGTVYRSLTALTRAVTGSHRNGFEFFGLRKKAGEK